MKSHFSKREWWGVGTIFVLIIFFLACGFFVFPNIFTVYPPHSFFASTTPSAVSSESVVATSSVPRIIHLNTPVPLKGIYMTSWVAGTKSLRDKVIKEFFGPTEINAVVIDIKDYTGQIAFPVEDPYLKKFNTDSKRIPDIESLIRELHEKNIYVIGRIAVFQDPLLVAKRPDLAVKKKDQIHIWKDRKGISWLDAGEKEVWDYVIAIANEAYRVGFDEINFDYIRFPSDGNMADIYFSASEGKVKADVMKSFYRYVYSKMVLGRPADAPRPKISADLFGMVTTNTDDLMIGQVLENALPYFDYISPMVYPSHFPTGFIGIKNPANEPYKVIKYSMDRAVARTLAASSTPDKIRPWLQDFNLGAVYTSDMVYAQMKATYDSGLTSWLLWNASVRYNLGAIRKDELFAKDGSMMATSTSASR